MKLLQCPFCGDDAELNDYDGGYWIECTGCHVFTEPTLADETDLLVEKWNSRVKGLTSVQTAALKLLKKHGSLDYNEVRYSFYVSGSVKHDRNRIQMGTAKALVRKGLAKVSREKPFRGKASIDQISSTNAD
ncbi:Lar family restriction alleviation protein [Microbulbifer sp. TYP-18]|uniref:Lar family restriction alleviation protein n=1 Tax=Microbulbifer sp. TYP-18 TaxID=3230024 RepID=UPI0034C60F72